MEKNELGMTHKKKEFSEWYPELLIRSEFIDYSLVSGAIVFRPSAYFAWEIIKDYVDKEFKKIGIENVYFPLFIPESLLLKEAEHFEGFSPEVAWVTHAGKSELSERLAVRPTSETIMYYSYAKWIRSWRDLPLRYNQWNNVVRWEFKNPTPFIRTREFLWNEGHSVFASEQEARAERDQILGIYLKALRELTCLYGIVGKKTDYEKFAGAVESYSIELVMPDGWCVQGPDFHYDGQNFSKAFDIKFINKESKEEYAYQNTYAISTRVLGVMVATHSDDKGLVLPPKLAQKQVVIVPIPARSEDIDKKLQDYSEKVLNTLKEHGLRAFIDNRDNYTPGYKFNEWELKGVPFRLEIGKKELESNTVVIAIRDTSEKKGVSLDKLIEAIDNEIEAMHNRLYENSKRMVQSFIHNIESYDELKKNIANGGIYHAPWCGSTDCEIKIKQETGAKITNIPLDQSDLHGRCIYCNKEARYMANFARSY
ncbi:MAG: proline--tRNA ligase 2 [Candidatus Micrarchaeota archaeon]|nr:MAG: proline--tRNA ligase 2 [Candidatus Micrarchaeota archaeon]